MASQVSHTCVNSSESWSADWSIVTGLEFIMATSKVKVLWSRRTRSRSSILDLQAALLATMLPSANPAITPQLKRSTCTLSVSRCSKLSLTNIRSGLARVVISVRSLATIFTSITNVFGTCGSEDRKRKKEQSVSLLSCVTSSTTWSIKIQLKGGPWTRWWRAHGTRQWMTGSWTLIKPPQTSLATSW